MQGSPIEFRTTKGRGDPRTHVPAATAPTLTAIETEAIEPSDIVNSALNGLQRDMYSVEVCTFPAQYQMKCGQHHMATNGDVAC